MFILDVGETIFNIVLIVFFICLFIYLPVINLLMIFLKDDKEPVHVGIYLFWRLLR